MHVQCGLRYSAQGLCRAIACGVSASRLREPRSLRRTLQAGEEGYAFSLTTFSPSGKLLQIEHALKAVSVGKTSLGIQGLLCIGGMGARLSTLHPPRHSTAATNGVVLATERKAPSILVDEDTMEKVAFITNSIGEIKSELALS